MYCIARYQQVGAVQSEQMPSARRVNWAKFRASAVCLVAILIFLTLAYLLTGGRLLQQKVKVYMFVRDATGLSVGSPVRVDGIGVGKVATLRLTGSSDPSRAVEVTMNVARADLVSIAVDSFAQLSTDTLIGDKFVDITSGRDPNHIGPDSEIRFKDHPELMKSLDLTDFEKQLRSVDATLTEIEQGQGLVGQFVKGEQVYDTLLQKIAEFQKEIRAIANVNTELGRALYSDEMYRQIRDPLVEFDQTLAKIQSGQGTAGEMFRDAAQYEQLRATARDLLHTVNDLRSQPMMTSDTEYAAWNRLMTSVIRSVDEVNANPLLNGSDVYENLNGMAKELGATVRDFREHPSKYLRLKY